MANRTISYGDLKVTLTSQFNFIWNDEKSGSRRDGAFWHPVSHDDLRPLGSVVVPHHGNLSGIWAALIVADDPAHRPAGETRPTVKAPVDYEFVWDDTDSGARLDGSVWRPVAPQGYIAVGDVANLGHGKPDLDRVWCLRSDLVRDAQYDEHEGPVWDDMGSGGKHDGSFWAVYPSKGNKGSAGEYIPVLAGTFLTAKGYGTPNQNDVAPSVPALYVPRQVTSFTSRPPEFPAGSRLPEVGDLFDQTEQGAFTLPYTSFFSPGDQGCLRLIADPFCTVGKQVSWLVAHKIPNHKAGTLTEQCSNRNGVTKTETKSTENTVGVNISSEVGYGLSKWSINLSYQFSFSQSSSVEEVQENIWVKTITVSPHSTAIVWAKKVVVQAVRSDGRKIDGEITFTANEDLAVTEIPDSV